MARVTASPTEPATLAGAAVEPHKFIFRALAAGPAA